MIKSNDLGLLILRISIGAMMLLHGISKLDGISSLVTRFEGAGLPGIMAYGVYITEIIAPLLIIIGYRVRLSSLVFASGVLFIILFAHSEDIFTFSKHGAWGIELLGLYLFGSITLFFTGGGKIGVSSSNVWD